MTTLTTDYPKNFTKAENDIFSWTSTAADFLTHKASGKQVYQMQWYAWKNSQPITDVTIKAAVTEFWTALKELKAAAEKVKWATPSYKAEEKGDGWCDKCESYCYGDCQA